MGDDQLRWDDERLAVKGDSRRVARFRRLQSWYREIHLHALHAVHPLRVGSRLHPDDVAEDPSLNFLTFAAKAHAAERPPVVLAEGGQIDKQRLLGNMLSSMPMCFNLFGSLRAEPAFVEVFRAVFDPSAAEISDVLCEWGPGNTARAEFLGDHTAFDALVTYRRDDGSPAFLAVETKYTDSFSPETYDTTLYRQVTEESSWFADDPGVADRLLARASNQMWRNTMLAAVLESKGTFGSGSVAVVCPSDDQAAEKAVSLVRTELTEPSRLQLVDLETIVAMADRTSSAALRGWASAFRLRYLDVGAPDRYS